MRLYVDLVVLLNVLVDFMLLLGTNCLTGYPPCIKRVVPAALLGGIYAGSCLLPGFHFLGNTLWRLVSLGLISMVAFGWGQSAWRRCGMFVLLTMALGGVVSSLNSDRMSMILLSASGIWLLCRLIFGSGQSGREYVQLEIKNNTQTICLVALRDTGNTLRDPITGEQVLVVGGDEARRLSGLSDAQLRHPIETMAKQRIPGLRLIPYKSVGTPGGMLLGMRFRDVKMGGQTCQVLVAFAPERIGRGEGFQALMGGVV